MASNHPVSPPSIPTARSSIISESIPVTSTKVLSDDLYNISYLLKRMRGERTSKNSLSLIEQQKDSKMTNWLSANSIRHQMPLLNSNIPLIDTHQQQQTVINTPIHEYKKILQFHLDRLKNKEKKVDIHKSNNKFQRKQKNPYKRFSRLEKDEKQQFNNATYCIAYCTIIIIGVTIGGWIGGLFELMFDGHNGCNNEYRGDFKCHVKYASFNVTTHCINTFYRKSIPNNFPYICLCRFRNNSKGKYRDCEFLHAKIQYI